LALALPSSAAWEEKVLVSLFFLTFTVGHLQKKVYIDNQVATIKNILNSATNTMTLKGPLRKMIQKSRTGFKSREDSIAVSGSEAKTNVLRRAHPAPTEELFSRQGKWQELGRSLHDEEPTFAHGDSMLHMVCRYHPPISAVRQLLNKRAPLLAVQEVNSAGQTPLHVAAACGASFKIVQLLLEQCPDTAVAQDSQGNTPLHLHIANTCRRKVCDPGVNVPNLTTKNSNRGKHLLKSTSKRFNASSNTASSGRRTSWTSSLFPSLPHQSIFYASSNYKKEERGLAKASKRDSLTWIKSAAEERNNIGESEHFKFLVMGPTQEVVYALANCSPFSLVIENNEGVSVVELAIIYEADLKTVEKLQETARRHFKLIAIGGSSKPSPSSMGASCARNAAC
jgi:hypothetical protein